MVKYLLKRIVSSMIIYYSMTIDSQHPRHAGGKGLLKCLYTTLYYGWQVSSMGHSEQQ